MGRVNREFGSSAGEKFCGAPVNQLRASRPQVCRRMDRRNKADSGPKAWLFGPLTKQTTKIELSLNPGGLARDQCVEVMFQPWENRHENASFAHDDTGCSYPSFHPIGLGRVCLKL